MYTATAFRRNQLRGQLVEIKAKLPNMRGRLDRPKPPVNTGIESRVHNATVGIIRDVFGYVTVTFVCAKN